MNTARAYLGAATASNGLIYAIGGENALNPNVLQDLGTVEAYSPTSNTWNDNLAPMPTPRHFLAVVTGSDGLIYALGGETEQNQILNNLEAYDPTTNTWAEEPPMPTARWSLSAVTGPDGLIYAMGGTDASGKPASTVEVYNPASKSWTTFDCLVNGTFQAGAALDNNGKIYVIGGETDETQVQPFSPSNGMEHSVTPKPGVSLSAVSLTFSAQDTGTTSSPQVVTLYETGAGSLTITNIDASGDFTETNTCNGAVAPLSTCTINVTFSPTAAGTRTGAITVTDNAGGSPQTVILTGAATAPVVSLSSSSLAFGNQQVGTTSAPQTVTLNNTGTGQLDVTSVIASGEFTETNTCGSPVATGANCAVTVTFAPTASGSLAGTLTVTDNAPGSPQTVSLTGIGIEALASLSTTSLSFSGELVGVASAAQAVTLANKGNEALTIKSITASGDFAETNSCGPNLAVNGNCIISVTFKPTAGGTRSGTLTLTDSATGGAQTVSLTGAGQDFSFGPPAGGSTTASTSPGQSATYTLSLAGLGGLSQPVAFTCTGAPSEATCSVSPTTLTLSSSAANVTVTVTTTTASLAPPPGGTNHSPGGLRWLIVAALIGLMGLTARHRLCGNQQAFSLTGPGGAGPGARRMRLVPMLAGLAVVALMALGMAGCGGGGGSGPAPNPGTPAGTYSLAVTATANTTPPIAHSVTLSLKVQ